ncbi:Rcf1p [Sugiyamaella lignohabitans]|uniref:Respiratory supercomplex factor 1, mitochondrial n=1 Tax=Sugiyamaella lignohabitans TaxID=796027 RepID=A0A167E6L4_9ASCO|nr:Rcf1p [Sugiyamaella lignohabitans]ANB13710.1 Rcf1p [Sugiyamaella lignohabitans]
MSSVPPNSDYTSLTGEEDILDKLARKAKEQPVVPIGMLLTCGALYMSARALRGGNSKLANRMFYWRVGLQGFTVAALVIGGYYYGKPNRPTDRDSILRRTAKEREDIWIKELERVDEMDKERKARADAVALDKKERLRRQFEEARAASGKKDE